MSVRDEAVGGARVSASVTAGGLLWISRTLSGLLVIYPLLLAVEASGMVSGPDGDAVLFRPGSLLLLELVRVASAELGAAFKVLLLLGGLAMLAQLVVLAAALDVLSDEPSSLRERIGRSFGLFPRFLGLSAITLLAQAALLLAASLLGAAFKSALHENAERWRDIAPLALLALGVVACAACGGVQDIARASLVQEEQSAREALVRALTRLRQQPWSVLIGWYPSAAGALLAYLVAAWLTQRVALESASHRAIAASFAAHQLAVLLGIACRVRWLRAALSLADDQGDSSLR